MRISDWSSDVCSSDLIGDSSDVIVFDAAHTAAPIIDAVAGRNVVAVICTHGHNDHITVAPELATTLDAPVFLHPADEMLLRAVHPEADFRSGTHGLAVTAAGFHPIGKASARETGGAY